MSCSCVLSCRLGLQVTAQLSVRHLATGPPPSMCAASGHQGLAGARAVYDTTHSPIHSMQISTLCGAEFLVCWPHVWYACCSALSSYRAPLQWGPGNLRDDRFGDINITPPTTFSTGCGTRREKTQAPSQQLPPEVEQLFAHSSAAHLDPKPPGCIDMGSMGCMGLIPRPHRLLRVLAMALQEVDRCVPQLRY